MRSRFVRSLVLLLVIGLGWESQASQTCFYELTDQNRARILIGPNRTYAEAFHTDYSEYNALRILLDLIDMGKCQLPTPNRCVLAVDMFGHVQVFNGEGGIRTVVIGRYGEEANGRAALARFQEAGICAGFVVKRAR